MNLQQFIATYAVTATQSLTEMVFLDSSQLFIGSTGIDGTFNVYQYQPTVTGSLSSVVMPSFGPICDYNPYSKKFITGNGNTIYTYLQTCPNISMTLSTEGYCILCPLYCINCDFNGICSTCQPTYTLVTANNTCQPPLNTTNSTTNGTTNNTSNINNTSPLQPPTPNNNSMTYKDQMTVDPIYPYEEEIGGMSSS